MACDVMSSSTDDSTPASHQTSRHATSRHAVPHFDAEIQHAMGIRLTLLGVDVFLDQSDELEHSIDLDALLRLLFCAAARFQISANDQTSNVRIKITKHHLQHRNQK